MSGPVSDGQFVTEDGDVWCCEQCYNLASQSNELSPDDAEKRTE